jgi:hypothetical protein
MMKKLKLEVLGSEVIALNLADPSERAEAERYVQKFGRPLDYRQTLVAILEAVPTGGLDPTRLRQRRKIADKIDEAGDSVLLEEAEWAVLYQAVHATKYQTASRNVVRFLDDIEEAGRTDIAVREAEQGAD